MGAPGDLYGINLDPGAAGVHGVPNPSFPNGSIGGSDVGANERDDQRVRDLVEQTLNEETIITMLNNSLIVNNPNISGDTLIAEFYNSDDVVLINGSPSGSIFTTITGQNRTVTFDGSPVRYTVSGRFSIEYLPFAAGFVAFSGSVTCIARLYIDGVLIRGDHVAAGMRFQVTTDKLLATVQLNSIVVMEPSKQLLSVEGLKSAAVMTAALAAGSHTIRVDMRLTWSDDQYIDVQLWDEYYAFHTADSTKITSMQTFDAATIL